MMSYAFLNLPTSVAEMMGGTLILLATVSTVIFLGKRYFLYQWCSLILIIGGVVMVGASSIANNTDSSENPVFGIILIMFAFCIQATQMIVEEKLFRNYLLSPFKVIGMEGVFGLIISSVFLFIAYFIHCSNDLCFDGKLEDAPKAFVDLFKNGYLLFLFIGFVLTMGLYNALGVSVTKYASSSNRTTINTSKVVVLWLFFLLYPGEGGETFHWLQFGGFIPIVIGTFIFNAQDSKKTKQNIISEENNDLSSKLNGSDECS